MIQMFNCINFKFVFNDDLRKTKEIMQQSSWMSESVKLRFSCLMLIIHQIIDDWIA